jgi:hypothetical protein
MTSFRVIIKKSGVRGLTADDKYVEMYYVGNPETPYELGQLKRQANRAAALVGENASGVRSGLQKRWIYGNTAGAMRSILVGIVICLLVSCEDKLEDRPDYKKGYEAGYSDGENDGHTHTCQQIEHLTDSIYEALKEGQICQ